MKIPTKLRILGLTWKVRLRPLDEMGKYGLTDYKSQTIHIDEDLSDELKAQTLLHEIGHVLVWSLGLDQSHPLLKDIDIEEALVNAFTNGIFSVIKGNKLDFSR